MSGFFHADFADEAENILRYLQEKIFADSASLREICPYSWRTKPYLRGMKNLVVFFSLLFALPVFGQETGLIPYRVGDKYGFCDYNGNITITPHFDSVCFFSGYALAHPSAYAQVFNRVNGQMKGSVVDKKGKLYLTFLFDRVELIQAHGAANFFSNAMYELLERSAALQWLTQADSLLKVQVEKTERVNNSLFVYDKKRMTVYDSVKQKTVLPGYYDYIGFDATVNGINYYVAQVFGPKQGQSLYGWVNDRGETCLPIAYPGFMHMDLGGYDAGPILTRQQLTPVLLLIKKLYFYVSAIDLQGNMQLFNLEKKIQITKKPYQEISFFGKNDQGLLLFKTILIEDEKKKTGIMDETGKIIYENKYVDIRWETLPNKKRVIRALTVEETIPPQSAEVDPEVVGDTYEISAPDMVVVENPSPEKKTEPVKKQEPPKPIEPTVVCKKSRCGLQAGKTILVKAEYDSIVPYIAQKKQPAKQYIAYKKGLGYLYLVEIQKLVDIPFTKILTKPYPINLMKPDYLFFLQNGTEVTVIKNSTGLPEQTFSNVKHINTNYLGRILVIAPSRYCFYDPVNAVTNCFETDSLYEVLLGTHIVCRKNGKFTVVNYQDKPLTAFSHTNPFSVLNLEKGLFLENWDTKAKKFIVFKKEKTLSIPFRSIDPFIIPTDTYRRQGVYKVWDDRNKIFYFSKDGLVFYEPAP